MVDPAEQLFTSTETLVADPTDEFGLEDQNMQIYAKEQRQPHDPPLIKQTFEDWVMTRNYM